LKRLCSASSLVSTPVHGQITRIVLGDSTPQNTTPLGATADHPRGDMRQRAASSQTARRRTPPARRPGASPASTSWRLSSSASIAVVATSGLEDLDLVDYGGPAS
jgi:hypothetical protein